MKKNILLSFVLFIAVAISCSPRKNKFANRSYQSFVTYYNTLFHGQEALKKEFQTTEQAHKDNFQEGYIDIFTQNKLAIPEEETGINANFFGNLGSVPDQTETIGNLEKAEQKALKAIEKHSMLFGGVQKNKEIFNAYILLIEARIYQGKFRKALESINQVYQTMPNDKRLPLAKIYEGFILSKLKNYVRADEIFLELSSDKNLDKKYQKLASVYRAENLIKSNRKEEAVAELETAFTLNKNRKTKSRIAFLRGQVLASLDRKEEARASFVTAYKYANDFEFEVKSQIEIAKTFTNKNNYEEAKKYLENLSKKGTYASRKNEFYYAIGLMAQGVEKDDEAQEFFRKSLREKISDPHIRGLTYFEIGKDYQKKENYLKAGKYYDSAVSAIVHEATKEKMQELTANIKNISKNYYIIKNNDSILALAKLPLEERTAFFQKHIAELQEKERKEELTKKKNKKNQSFESLYYEPNFMGFGDDFGNKKSNKFYFANLNTIAKGSNEFKRIWGSRSLNDNWRYGENTNNNQIQSEQKENPETEKANPRRFELAYYEEQIPKEDSIILALKKDRDTASLGLGRMYDTYLQNRPLATKTLYDLVDNKPIDDVKLQALYLIFSMNHEKNPEQAERAKNMIIKEYPNTPYAIFVKNPRNTNFTESDVAVKNIYQKAYQLYIDEQFENSEKNG